MKEFDVCIVGSGAGASPIAYTLTKAGFKVVMLEKGEIFNEGDFSKDEIATVRREVYTPKLKDEYHTIEENIDNEWVKFPTYETGWSFWNGNILGGSSNFMSGFFYRLKPKDFKLKSIYGEIKGANVEDWPISYDDLEPFYEKVERVVGVSGEVSIYPHMEPRSTKTYPYPILEEHPITKLFDKSCKELGYNSIKTPRAVLSQKKEHRNPCYYSNYCGSYGCSSGAKGSARAALIKPALSTNNLTIITNAFVYKLNTDKNKKIKSASYIDKNTNKKKEIKAKLFVVATQAVESSRLLLNSKDENFPKGVANNSGNVGKNMLFTGGGFGSGDFDESNFDLEKLFVNGPFVNRALKDWYFTDEFKGGLVEFLFEHANPIRRANTLKWDNEGLVFGEKLQNRLHHMFTKTRKFQFEIFTDWMPNDDCFVSVDENYKDKYGIPVANIRIGAHPQDVKVANFLAKKGAKLLKQMGAKNISTDVSPLPAQNLQAGGCRFGDNPKTSVLNKFCQAHEVENLFVTDGSFMPTGGSVPYTWTIYANSFRVAEHIKNNRMTLL